MSRKPFAVSDAMREKVRHLAGLGVPQDDIAKLVGCAPKTLRKRFRNELDRGVVEANATVTGYLLAAAKAGNIAAIIFWLKTRPSAGARCGGSESSLPILGLIGAFALGKCRGDDAKQGGSGKARISINAVTADA